MVIAFKLSETSKKHSIALAMWLCVGMSNILFPRSLPHSLSLSCCVSNFILFDYLWLLHLCVFVCKISFDGQKNRERLGIWVYWEVYDQCTLCVTMCLCCACFMPKHWKNAKTNFRKRVVCIGTRQVI